MHQELKRKGRDAAVAVGGVSGRACAEALRYSCLIIRTRKRYFRPLIEKYKRRFSGFDEKIVALYARGMSVQCR